jgi:hypothetical protein
LPFLRVEAHHFFAHPNISSDPVVKLATLRSK